MIRPPAKPTLTFINKYRLRTQREERDIFDRNSNHEQAALPASLLFIDFDFP
jgi:hypothetical protein